MIHYFSLNEMQCTCGCDGLIVEPNFLDIMNLIRADFGRPMKVNRWYSCPTHDAELGGKGNHPRGMAADIACVHSLTRYHLMTLAEKHGIQRIGVGRTFLDMDTIPDAPTPRIWVYN